MLKFIYLSIDSYINSSIIDSCESFGIVSSQQAKVLCTERRSTMDRTWDPHLQRTFGNVKSNAAGSGLDREECKNQSLSANYFTAKDSQQSLPDTEFSFAPSPMQRDQQSSISGYSHDTSMRGSYDNIEHNRSSGFLMAPSEPPATTTFTFGAAPRHPVQNVSPAGKNAILPALYNITGQDLLSGYLSRPSFEPPQPMPRLSSYPAITSNNRNGQDRLSLPRFTSHIGSQAESNSFGEQKEPKVLNCADNYFKKQILPDIELKTKPKNRSSHLANSAFGEAHSPLTQLVNNMISQTSMSMPRHAGYSPPRQNIFQMQLERPQQFQPQNQQVTPPLTRTPDLSMRLILLFDICEKRIS